MATPPPHPTYRVTARMSIRVETPISLPSREEVERLLALPSPTPSPISPWSSPLPQIPSPPLPVSSPVPVSPPPLPARTPPLQPIPLPTPSPPLLLPSNDCREGVSNVTLPYQKRLCIALGPKYKVDESSSAPTARPSRGFRADYGFKDMVKDIQGTQAVTDVVELSQRMADFVTTVRQDTNEIYGRLDDAQDDRLLMSGRLNMLHRDRHAHARTALLMERERLDFLTEIATLRATDCARQAQLVETLRLMSTLQTQVAALQGQQGPAGGPAQPEIPEEIGSSS
ncbi:hypothetical protein Tco_0827329 [Tanacetum coccineum]